MHSSWILSPPGECSSRERPATRASLIGFCAAVALTLSLLGMSGRKAISGEKEDRLDLLKTFVSELVEITPGEGKFPARFQMGTPNGPWTEQPAHTVTMSGRFAMAKYEVPQNLYEAVMGKNPSRWKGLRNSAEEFSFEEAKQFCARLTTLLQEAQLIAMDEEIRLPTEAEWEYCCRAGTSTAYSFGELALTKEDVPPKASLLSRYAWHTGNAAGNDPPVGAKEPNDWGLYDMHGYLWEFVSDDWRETYDPQQASSSAESKPSDAANAARHVVRGGSWKDRYEALRSAHRRPVAADFHDDAVGLRCVRSKVRPKDATS